MSDLPDEILHMIFRQLDGKSAVRCRGVCRRWLQAVDSLSNNDWKQICSKSSFPRDEYEAVHQKYGLSWRDTYKAIHSWSRIGSAEMSTKEVSVGEVQRFIVLSNGHVAVLQNRKLKFLLTCSDTILYYNYENFELNGEEEFDFAFYSRHYNENEYLIVLVELNCGSLNIIIKETKQKFTVGNLFFYDLNKGDNYTLNGKEVYFKNTKDKMVYISKLKAENGESIVETEMLGGFRRNHEDLEELVTIEAISIVNGKVYILMSDYSMGNGGKIYEFKNSYFKLINKINFNVRRFTFDDLKMYGFDWRSKPIYRCLTNPFQEPAFYSHGGVFLTLNNDGNVVSCFYYPYTILNLRHLKEVSKNKDCHKVDKKKVFLFGLLPQCDATAKQLDIIETSTKPKILMLAENKLFVMEITFCSKKKKQKQLSHITENKVDNKQHQSDDNIEIKTDKKQLQSDVNDEIVPKMTDKRQLQTDDNDKSVEINIVKRQRKSLQIAIS